MSSELRREFLLQQKMDPLRKRGTLHLEKVVELNEFEGRIRLRQFSLQSSAPRSAKVTNPRVNSVRMSSSVGKDPYTNTRLR